MTPLRRLSPAVRTALPALVVRGIVLLLAGALLLLGASSSRATAQGGPSILATTVKGIITPVVADHLEEAIERAEREGHGALLVQVDTPGGLDTSMREIVQSFLNARVPVIVYVAPPGARAASAGAIITFSAHVAAMAPGTTIGAATPIDLEGGDLARKVINDAAAYAESIADLRGRNAEFAIEAVREGRSVTAEDAVKIGAVDLLADDWDDLLAEIDGSAVRVSPGVDVTLRTAGAEIVAHEMGRLRQLLQWLADPNIAFLFLSIGTLALLYELANPGIGGAGIVGVILLILGMFSLSVLPVNAAGLILLALAAVLFVAELFAPGIGVFAAGGTAALLLGGVLLFRGSVGVDTIVLLPTGLVVGGGTVLAGRIVWRTRRAPPTTGLAALLGRRAVVRTAGGMSGQVFLDGAWWNARTSGRPMEVGGTVRVTEVDGLDLVVEPDVEPEEGTS